MKTFFTLAFSLGFFLNGVAQDLAQTYSFAKQLEAREQYQQALLTYHRVLFFDEEGLFRHMVYGSMGTCYFQLGQYEKAAEYFDLGYFSEPDDSVRIELLFRKTSSLLLQQNYHYAQVELFNLPQKLSPYFEQKRQFYEGLTAFGLENFEEAERHFLSSVGPAHPQVKEEVSVAFDKLGKVEKISPRKAKVLSTILPGLGQLYAGDIRNGINSFLLTSAFAVLAYHTGLQYSFWDAVLSVLPWYQRYYMGGYARAELIARNKRAREREKIRTEVLDLLAKSKK